MALQEAQKTIQDALDQFANPKHNSTTCTAGTKGKLTTISARKPAKFLALFKSKTAVIRFESDD